MNNPKIINKKIVDIYKIWLTEIQNNSPQLLSDEFSNIFCTGVTDNWFSSDMRILIVGKEATWKSRKEYVYDDYYDELKKCQKWIIDELNSQLYDDTTKKLNRPFWQRIHDIHSAFPNASICRTNIDVINARNQRGLKEKDRKVLHNCNTKLLYEIIALIEPTHIIFFGWHNTSLEHELPELLKAAYPDGTADNKFMKNHNFIFKTKFSNKNVILSYHPNYAPICNNKSYINKLIEFIKQEN